MNKKYICYGGSVIAADGDSHYISPLELTRLWGVRKDDCVLVSSVESVAELRGMDRQFIDSLIELHPRNDNQYNLEELRSERNIARV